MIGFLLFLIFAELLDVVAELRKLREALGSRRADIPPNADARFYRR